MAVKKIALFGAMGGPGSPPGQAVQVGSEMIVLVWNTSSRLPAERREADQEGGQLSSGADQEGGVGLELCPCVWSLL